MRILALCGLIVAAVFAFDARRPAQAAPWCSTYGGVSCSYYTFEQCLTAIRGVGGNCTQNPAERAGERSKPSKRMREAKPKREPEKKPAAVRPPDKPITPRETAEPPKSSPPAPLVEQAPSQAQPTAKSFAEGRMLILSGKYEAGIAAMLALGYDDHPDVAASIGFASSKLGRTDDAKLWYEKALAADPNHVAALAGYGVLRVQQGDLPKAREDLEKIKALCGGTGCREYKELSDAIAAKTR